jgi:hypothetical protein
VTKKKAAAVVDEIKEDLTEVMRRGPGRPRKARGPNVERGVSITTTDRVEFWAQELEIRRRGCDEALEAGQYNALALLIPKFDAARIQWEAAVAEKGSTKGMSDAQLMTMLKELVPKLTREQRDELRSVL